MATAAPSERSLTAFERGLLAHVWVDETRPLLQGARLTAWELETAAIPHAVIADSAAGSLMAAGEVDCVITGADRIAANGDTANKIGTYSLAVLARHHDLPLYVVAPSTTLDLGTPDGASIPIEERDPAEVTARFAARNPAFDVTPAALIAAIVTERGVHRAPYVESLAEPSQREGADPRGGLRDPPPSADRHLGERAPAGRRPADHRSDRRRTWPRSPRSTRCTSSPTRARRRAFREWASGRDVTIHDDGTTSNDDRLGAIGDMQFVVDRVGADDDLLVIAGDNLFDFRLSDLVAFWRTKGVASAVAVRDVGSLELARQYGIVELDADGRIRSFVEKPAEPASTLAATATYVFHRDHVRLIRTYLDERAERRSARPLRRLAPAA